MRFGNLLKKELSELITKQAIISMVFILVLFVFMGQIMGKAMEESMNTSTITICNRDNTDFTNNILKDITADGSITIDYVDIQGDDYGAELERLDKKNCVIIPAGYADSVIKDKKPADIIFVSKLSVGGMEASMSSISASDMINSIQEATTDAVLLQTYGLDEEEVARIKEPASLVEFTFTNGKTAKISATAIQGIMMMQSMIAPFVIFFLLLMASQMIMTAISTEKIDKTLETLLSTPVPRMTVLMAKMVAAVISALLNAVVMMIGFTCYMTGMMGNLTEELSTVDSSAILDGTSVSVTQAMADLGLTLTPVSYVLFGIQLFLTVAIGLAVSLILGAMATDVKSVQTLTMPIMITVMIPFFITMFMDFSSMSTAFKAVMFIIPFTHTYTALTNLMNGDMIMFWAGMVYQILFFCVCMFLAVRMFTTDKIFTMSVSSDSTRKNAKRFPATK